MYRYSSAQTFTCFEIIGFQKFVFPRLELGAMTYRQYPAIWIKLISVGRYLIEI